jgi:hypothetical protein
MLVGTFGIETAINPTPLRKESAMKPTKAKQQQYNGDISRNFKDVFSRLRELTGRVEELNKNAIGSVKDTNATIHEAAEGINQIVVMFAELRARVELLERLMLGDNRSPERIPPHAVN